MPLLLLAALAATPVSGRFVLEVEGLPVAELRVTSDGARYVYEATHFLDEGPAETRFEFALATLPAPPEVLTLLSRPAPGCREVLEERTRALETLCVEGPARKAVTGTIAGDRFVAHYDAKHALRDIKVGSASWRAVSTATTPPLESPFTRGVAVEEGALRLEPAVAGARWLTTAPLGVGSEDELGRARCLVLSRRALEGHPQRRLAVGLVIEAGRAFPHAWVVEADRALDPSVAAGDEVLQRRQYLELPKARSGVFYLQLFDGAVKLVPR